jgi:hypothetical protein
MGTESRRPFIKTCSNPKIQSSKLNSSCNLERTRRMDRPVGIIRTGPFWEGKINSSVSFTELAAALRRMATIMREKGEVERAIVVNMAADEAEMFLETAGWVDESSEGKRTV